MSEPCMEKWLYGSEADALLIKNAPDGKMVPLDNEPRVVCHIDGIPIIGYPTMDGPDAPIDGAKP